MSPQTEQLAQQRRKVCNRGVDRYTQEDQEVMEPCVAKLMQAADIPSRKRGSAAEFRRFIDDACELKSCKKTSIRKASKEFRQSA